MPKITLYVSPEGRLTIEYPEGMTEEEALQRVLFHLKQKEK